MLFMDNVNTQTVTDELEQSLGVINTEFSFFHISSTHKVQPLDTEILKKFKYSWLEIWKLQKVQLIEDEEWLMLADFEIKGSHIVRH